MKKIEEIAAKTAWKLADASVNKREFDSLIIKKSIAGLVIPAFFMSTFLF